MDAEPTYSVHLEIEIVVVIMKSGFTKVEIVLQTPTSIEWWYL